jgi:oligoribonuclease NrnB/cAMP/cGMP phosphodiesterase (DHH superfamily)
VLDHHKTAEEALKDLEHPNLNITFDMNKSGARLTWEFFSADKTPQDPPWLIKFIEDRDLWRFAIPGSAEVHTYLQSFPFDFDKWDGIYASLENRGSRAGVIEAGKSIVRFRDTQVSQICDQAELRTIGGHEVPVVNATAFWSEVGHELLERFPERPFVVSWYRGKDGKVKLSLRSRKEFDCSVVAKLYGGGGHAQASGAELAFDSWTEILKG